jgi:hypothetical protein
LGFGISFLSDGDLHRIFLELSAGWLHRCGTVQTAQIRASIEPQPQNMRNGVRFVACGKSSALYSIRNLEEWEG